MKIELDDAIINKLGVDHKEIMELLAIALYKYKGVHGALAGKLINKSEFEFHAMLSNRGIEVNYGAKDLLDDINNNSL